MVKITLSLEFNPTLIAVAIGVALIGPGKYALDLFLF